MRKVRTMQRGVLMLALLSGLGLPLAAAAQQPPPPPPPPLPPPARPVPIVSPAPVLAPMPAGLDLSGMLLDAQMRLMAVQPVLEATRLLDLSALDVGPLMPPMPMLDMGLSGLALADVGIALEPLAALAPLAADMTPMLIHAVPFFGLHAATPGRGAVELPHMPEPKGTAPPDSLYREARKALTGGDYRGAVRILRQLREKYPRSDYTPDSYYWEAYALYRIGGQTELKQARTLLAEQASRHPNAATRRGDAPALQAQINGQLARLGDPEAAEAIAATAETAAPPGVPAVAPSASRPGQSGVQVGPQRQQQNDEDDVALAALNALAQMDAERAMPILKQVLARRDEVSVRLRRQALFVVARQKTAESESILLDAARNDPDPDVRAQAVYWLSAIPSDRAVTVLDSVLRNSEDRKIQNQAIYALSRQKDERATRALREFLLQSDATDEARGQAAMFLGRDSDNHAFLRDAFQRVPSQKVKEQILVSLARSDDAQNRQWVMQVAMDQSQPIELRKSALYWAARRKDMQVSELSRLYDQMSDREIRQQLIYALAQRDDSASVDKLMAIAQHDTDVQMRKQAIFWLGRSKDPRAPEFLMKLINP